MNARIEVHTRSLGQGPTVLCIHSSGASARQWDALAERLQGRFRVVAADLHGHGGTPAWPGPRGARLADEADLLSPLLSLPADGVHLVGHSYGAAVALRLALTHPQRVRSVSVYEPTLFRVLFDANAAHRDALEVARVAVDIRRLAAAGELAAAGRRFVDYWGGAGSWQRLPRPRQDAVARRMVVVRDHFRALLNDDTRLSGYARLRCPVLVLSGGASPAPVRSIARRVSGVLAQSEFVELPGLGHMAPVTRPDAVNPLIEAFLAGHAGRAAAPPGNHEQPAAQALAA
jgi:pimeloyl-ACP methyl ester carboxylesterase